MAVKKSANKKQSKKVVAKKASAKKTATKAVAKKAAAKKSPAKKAVAKKAAAKKSPVKKAVAKKAAAKKSPAKKAVAKKVAAKKSPAKKAVAKKVAAKKSPAKKAVAKKAAAKKSPAKKAVAQKAVAKKATAKKTPVSKASTAPARKSGSAFSGPIHGVKPYVSKRGEMYMGEAQLEHFRQILLNWKRELMEEVDRTVHHMQDEAANFPDPNDRATQESEFGLELRTRDRERKLLKKIDSALKRVEDGSYGYCEETGDEIGLKRLEARPVATLSLEAQERRELAERQFRDRDDRYR
ncbi:MAG: RNA polymerase-binding protein DksA [Chromatiales bacterium]|nr:RNA polymerase-binding protein DksA [Chromatiales bacterium]